MSTIKANVVQSTTGGATTLTDLYPARAWVNFNGAGTVAIRAEGNVSSISDIGTGAIRVNFTSAFGDAFYSCPAGLSDSDINAAQAIMVQPELTSRLRIQTDAVNGDPDDCDYVFISVIR